MVTFSFGSAEIEYIAKGDNSWKYQAVGTKKYEDDKDDKFEYKESFLTSNWKMFHDAALIHRF